MLLLITKRVTDQLNRQTGVIQHDKAWLVADDSHQLRRYWIVDLNEMSTSHQLAAGRSTIRRHPRHSRADIS